MNPVQALEMISTLSGVLVGAIALISLRELVFPTWFGWLSVVITLGLLSPFGYAVIGIAVVWLFAVSIWLYARGTTRLAPSATN